MRVLVISTIFPNAQEPTEYPYNRQQFASLSQLCDIEVLATLPWFPGAHLFKKKTRAGLVIDVPSHETIAGLEVHHPRVLYFPKFGTALNGLLYATSIYGLVKRYRETVDVILCAWAFPDGVAAILLGELLNLPVVVKFHGSDLNVLPKMLGPRLNLKWALPHAMRLVSVSKPLAEIAVQLGARRERVAIVYNGVDTRIFYPREKSAMRALLGRQDDERILLYVGLLHRAKGILDLFEAFKKIAFLDPRLKLVVLGEGPEQKNIEKLAAQFGRRVTLVGPSPLEEVARWMGAADIITLPSWNEGTPNVVLEALASGRKVVATRVGGVPDLITSPMLGEMVEAHDTGALGEVLLRAASSSYDPQAIASAGSRGDWATSARHLHRVLADAVEDYDRQRRS